MVIGANIGTTVTNTLASLAVLCPEGLSTTLVHTLFNLTALALLSPHSQIRVVPIRAAEWLAEQAVNHRTVDVAYVLGLFLVVTLLGTVLLNKDHQMVFGLTRRDDGGRLDRIEAAFQRMFIDDRHAFDMAMSALIGGASPGTVGNDIRTTDRKVNEAEREIRRELVVHAGGHGGFEAPAVLVYMSIVKDVERIGDYAKNLYDIAADGVVLDRGELMTEMLELRGRVSTLISDVAEIFGQRDTQRARASFQDGDRLLDDCDRRVSDLVTGRIGEPYAVAYALTYRYLKRIVAHLMNVLSAVVMPVDQLDYFDEDPEDRVDRHDDDQH